MAALVWGAVEDRNYEQGLEKGVLYLPNKDGVVWNGLISLTEKALGGELDSSYFDGIKTVDSVANRSYQAELKAFSYPEEFEICLGNSILREGILMTGQTPLSFGLSYRTKLNDVNYKLHLIYNVIAIKTTSEYLTMAKSPSISVMGWTLSASPSDIETLYTPTAHLIIDSTKVSPISLSSLENLLYGTSMVNAQLPTQAVVRSLF